MRKLVIYIFIPIFAVLLMSHNVSAIDLVVDLNQYESVRYLNSFGNDCTFSNVTNGVGSNSVWCSATINGNASLLSIESHDTYSFEKGDLVNFYVLIRSDYNQELLHKPYLNLFNGNTNTSQFNFVSYKVVSASDFFQHYDIISTLSGSQQGGITNYNQLGDLVNYSSFLNIYEFTMMARNSGTYKYGLNATGSSGLFVFNSDDNGYKFYARLMGLNHYRFSGSQENKEQAEATQNAVDDSEDAGDSSSTSAEGATSNLLSVFGAFANVITNASPTNCVIDAPLNTNFSSDRFHVDLCGLNLPPAIGTLTSIIAVMVVVPFALSMFNKFIGIMESFQK